MANKIPKFQLHLQDSTLTATAAAPVQGAFGTRIRPPTEEERQERSRALRAEAQLLNTINSE